jgi:hypothetical protein
MGEPLMWLHRIHLPKMDNQIAGKHNSDDANQPGKIAHFSPIIVAMLVDQSSFRKRRLMDNSD